MIWITDVVGSFFRPGGAGQRPPQVSMGHGDECVGAVESVARLVNARRWVLVASDFALDSP